MKSIISKARTIPSKFYTCSAHYKRELEAVFKKNWVCVGHVNTLKRAGDYFTGFLGKEPYLVTKAPEAIKAYHNVCRHHGTLLLNSPCGHIANGTICCKYHGWTYDYSTGRLIKATRMKGIEDFKVKDYGLHEIQCKVWGPLIFANFGGEIPALPDQTSIMDFGGLHFVKSHTYDVKCNWKVYVDNYLDGGYHISHAHKDLASSLDLTSYKTEVHSRHSVQSCTSVANDKRLGSQTHAKYVWMYPNLMLNRYGKWLDTNLVVPTGPETCKVVFDYYTTSDGRTQMDSDDDIKASDVIQDEDRDLCEQVQLGMHSSSFTHGRYAPSVEHGMFHFHQLLTADLEK